MTEYKTTANDSASQNKLVTVRQMFSDGPAIKAEAPLKLRRSSLSLQAVASPCLQVLMCTAPLSSDLIFSLF